jgi:hypothetical protein
VNVGEGRRDEHRKKSEAEETFHECE